MPPGPSRGEFLEVGGRRARWGRPASADPRPRPKVGEAGAVPPHTSSLPLSRASSPSRTVLLGYRFFSNSQLLTCRVHRSHLVWWGQGWGVACVAVQPCLCGNLPASLPSWRAGGGESLASGCGTKPSQGAHVTAVCLGGGSCRGQCKGVTPERAGARRKPPISAGGSLGVASSGLPLDCRGQYKVTLSLCHFGVMRGLRA